MLEQICKNAQMGKNALFKLNTVQKNEILKFCVDAILSHSKDILSENEKDLKNAEKIGLNQSLQDRLRLNPQRINQMANGILQIISMPDPTSNILSTKILSNGLKLTKKATPIGVIAIIYESRPNVTLDAFALSFKSSNSLILKGGKEAINSNKAIVNILKSAILSWQKNTNYKDDDLIYTINLIENTDRQTTQKLLKMHNFIDLLIPRGSASLINEVVQNSTIPTLQTGIGNCHIYVDKNANLQKAAKIIHNAKLSRPSVCNAAESLLVYKDIANDLFAELLNYQNGDFFKQTTIKADEKTIEILKNLAKKYEISIVCMDEIIKNDFSDDYKNIFDVKNKTTIKLQKATLDDYRCEFLAPILAIKCVDDINEAIEHINTYSSGHSECIITQDITAAMHFENSINSAVVYVNASTRFSDGGCFGFGGEMGISTQKLHARGPVGLNELVSYKYVVVGDGQIRV